MCQPVIIIVHVDDLHNIFISFFDVFTLVLHWFHIEVQQPHIEDTMHIHLKCTFQHQKTKREGVPSLPSMFFIFIHFYLLLGGELINQIQFFNLFAHIRSKQIKIILSYFQTAMPKNLWKGNDIATIQNPLLCKCVSVTMNASRFDASRLVVVI